MNKNIPQKKLDKLVKCMSVPISCKEFLFLTRNVVRQIKAKQGNLSDFITKYELTELEIQEIQFLLNYT